VYGPIFIPEVEPAGGIIFTIDPVQLILARMLASCNHAFDFEWGFQLGGTGG